MRPFCIIIFLIFYTISSAQSGLQPIGSWKEYLPYGSAIDVTASANKIYCATPYSLFSINTATKEAERISKISGLSETGISAVQYDSVSNKLFVAYTNSNIDVLDATTIHNIPDLKRDSRGGNKTIYHIFTDNHTCYLSTGLGVIVLDAEKYEIKDSWLIGSSGNFVQTNMVTKDNDFFYAATEEGLKKAPVNSNLSDYSIWQNLSGNNGLTATSCKGVINLNNKIIALQNDSLFLQNGNGWTLFFANNFPVVSINLSNNHIIVCQRTAAGDSKVTVLNADGSVQKTIQQPAVISFPKKGILYDNEYWIADLYGGLSQWQGSTFEQYKLNSPEDIATGEMTVYNNILYATAGAVNDAWNYQYNGNGVYQYANSEWTNYNRFHFPQLDSMLDFITVAIDPRDESVWAGSYGGGLLHIKKNNQFDIYKQNSPIAQALGDPASYRVSGLAFDAQNNLWVANYAAAQYLHVLKSNGQWLSFITPFRLVENAMGQIIVDDMNQLWIVSPKGNGLICYNYGNSIDNTADDQWRLYTSSDGNLPSSDVRCIAKDKSGFIWVGTADGVGVIQCPQQVFGSNGCSAILPVIKGDNFANYLFKGEIVQSIAVDAADRKWVATQNGVWLMSSEADKVLLHFTEDNSPLLNNDVRRIAVNGTTGEVFFATASGICSYRGGATEAADSTNKVLIFPNPVPPGYGGTIAIKGLTENSYVKITELNGRLVYQTKALGAQAVWNGKDYRGNSISSGIYLVIMVDENGQGKAVGKIVFISK